MTANRDEERAAARLAEQPRLALSGWEGESISLSDVNGLTAQDVGGGGFNLPRGEGGSEGGSSGGSALAGGLACVYFAQAVEGGDFVLLIVMGCGSIVVGDKLQDTRVGLVRYFAAHHEDFSWPDVEVGNGIGCKGGRQSGLALDGIDVVGKMVARGGIGGSGERHGKGGEVGRAWMTNDGGGILDCIGVMGGMLAEGVNERKGGHYGEGGKVAPGFNVSTFDPGAHPPKKTYVRYSRAKEGEDGAGKQSLKKRAAEDMETNQDEEDGGANPFRFQG